MTDTDRVAARLAEAAKRYRTAAGTPHTSRQVVAASADDVPYLLDVLEAVLALAKDWEEAATKLAAAADRAAERGALPERTNLMDGRAQAQQDCAQALREYIGRWLGEETGNATHPG